MTGTQMNWTYMWFTFTNLLTLSALSARKVKSNILNSPSNGVISSSYWIENCLVQWDGHVKWISEILPSLNLQTLSSCNQAWWVMLKDRYNQIQPDTSRYKQIQADTSRYKQIRPDTTRYKQIQTDTTRYKQIQTDTSR